jgi:hypothetical protein
MNATSLYLRLESLPAGPAVWKLIMLSIHAWRRVRSWALEEAMLCSWLPQTWRDAALERRLEIVAAWQQELRDLKRLAAEL